MRCFQTFNDTSITYVKFHTKNTSNIAYLENKEINKFEHYFCLTEFFVANS